MSDSHQIRIQSGLGATSGAPLVGLVVNDQKPIVLTPDEARAIAFDLISAAGAAEQELTSAPARAAEGPP